MSSEIMRPPGNVWTDIMQGLAMGGGALFLGTIIHPVVGIIGCGLAGMWLNARLWCRMD